MEQYNVANINLIIEGPGYPYCSQRMKEYRARSDKCDVYVNFSTPEEITLPPGRVIGKMHRWEWLQTGNGQYAGFQRHPETGRILSLMEADEGWERVTLRLAHFENDFGIDLDRRCFASIGDIFIYSVLRRGGLVLHSSAISYNGEGILFSAPSGMGKSTHVSLWKEYYDNTVIINDDMPAIVFEGDKAVVCGTPWSGKTDINCNKRAALAAIVFLERGQACSITKISGAQALSRLLSELRKSVYTEMMDICLRSLDRLLENVPIYLLSCNVSKAAVDLVKKTVLI